MNHNEICQLAQAEIKRLNRLNGDGRLDSVIDRWTDIVAHYRDAANEIPCGIAKAERDRVIYCAPAFLDGDS